MIRKITLLYIVLFLFLIVGICTCNIFAQDTITTSTSTKNEFPDSITFYLEANSSAEIDEVIFRYRIDIISPVNVTSLVDTKFLSSPSIETKWKWDMHTSSSLPPGADIEYSWSIEDIVGNEVTTPWQTFEFNDNHYDWSSISEGNITLYWYRGGTAFAYELLQTATDSLHRLYDDTGAKLNQPVDIYIYASSADLREAFVYPQEWTGGAAFTAYGIVAIGVAPEDLAWGKRTITHELAHLVTYQMTSNPYSDIPTWLNEGLSMYAEGEPDISFKTSLENAVKDDELISVQTLSSNFPTDFEEAYLSYAESYSIVKFLIDRYGSEHILKLLNVFKEGSTYDRALEEVYGFDSLGLYNAWRVSLGLGPVIELSPTPESTPASNPQNGIFGCGAASGETSYIPLIAFGILGVALIPSIRKIIGRRRNKK